MRLAVVLVLAACGTKAPQVAPDAPPDSFVDPCDACTADQLCVQGFDGTCRVSTTCVPRAATCHDPVLTDQVCSAACNAAYCQAPEVCTDRMGCGKMPSPKAFTCYGP